MSRALIHDLATRDGEEPLGASHSPRGDPAGYRVIYREAHTLQELAAATFDGTRKLHLTELAAVPLLIVDDLGTRKLPPTASRSPHAGAQSGCIEFADECGE